VEIKGIKFVCPVLDGSGYASASRQNILALHKLGIPITIKPVSFEKARPDLGEDGKIIHSLIDKKIDYNIIFCQLTPEWWADHKESSKLFCGYTVWETDRLHPDWIGYINNTADICFVPCEWNVEVFKRSGIKVPIFNIPHVMDVNRFKNVEPFKVAGVSDDTFMFYFIGQWTERKSVLSLIKTYWRTFRNDENVALVMKTYRSDYSDAEKEAIRTTIKRLKMVCPMDSYPPIYLILNMLTDAEIYGLHARGDCYVSLDHGEGFGMSSASAGAAANPVIATGGGGVTEYLKPDNGYPIRFFEGPVFGMPFSPWYRLEQYWLNCDEKHASQTMRYVYENQEEAKERGLKLQKYIAENLSWEHIGNRIVKELEKI
jgi:glycosyltransferase involved in cell wall biosynthesis